MSSQESPRHSLADSLESDDELAEFMSNKEGSGSDTEDASEDGGTGTSQKPVTEIKEQVYLEKLGLLKAQLAQLEDGVFPAYVRGVEKFAAVYKERLDLNSVWKAYATDCIESDFMDEKKASVREFEVKKIELKDNLLQEYEEKKKQIEEDRYGISILMDSPEAKPASTRKLRRRPNEPTPLPENKRRKLPQSTITFVLDDKEVEEDLVGLYKGNASESNPPTDQSSSSTGEGSTTSSKSRSKSPSPVPATHIRIEDGKLFYERRWYHRGQPVYIEGKDLNRMSAVICGICQDAVWIRKDGDNGKIRVTVGQLVKGKYSIERRA